MRFQRAIVVGSSGGIGAALAAALADHGAEVTAMSRSGREGGDRYRSVRIDIQDENSITSAAAEAEPHGPYDLIIVATGILHNSHLAPEKSYKQLSAEAFQQYFAVNTIGPALVAKHFLPLLNLKEPAVFAALSARVGSISDNRLGGWYGYRASKAALNMMVKSLAVELARTRPSAICIALHPGTVDTGLSEPFQRGVPPHQLFTPATSAKHLLQVVSKLGPSANGGCFAWDGSKVDF
jgi:NAD(P)-dependent dehydrogenase (short-subunit alcohol dehydrogenase family)